MSLRPTTIIAALLAVIVIAGAAVFAYDASHRDLVADGVRVGDVQIGGLRADAARDRLTKRLLLPLDEPVVVIADDKTFTLSAREARIHANIEAMVDEAVGRGREGGVLARTWRAIAGTPVDEQIAPEIDYSRPAVQRLVDRVRVAVGRKPRDAKVEFEADSVKVRAAKAGRSIDTGRLRADVEAALVSSIAARTVTAPVQIVQPQVTGEGLADKYPVVVTIDRGRFRLNLFKKLERVKTYPIAVGQVGLETPAGLYKIQNKAINPAWHVPNSDWAGDLAGKVIPGGTPENPIKARWLGVYDGVGVHGTDARNSIGTNASHGCIRMLVEHVEKLYDQVPVGTPIYID